MDQDYAILQTGVENVLAMRSTIPMIKRMTLAYQKRRHQEELKRQAALDLQQQPDPPVSARLTKPAP